MNTGRNPGLLGLTAGVGLGVLFALLGFVGVFSVPVGLGLGAIGVFVGAFLYLFFMRGTTVARVGYASLLFTLTYGYWAAKDKVAERVLVPMLDILQSIPVLSFMPGLVIGLSALLGNVGLEIAAVLLMLVGWRVLRRRRRRPKREAAVSPWMSTGARM